MKGNVDGWVGGWVNGRGARTSEVGVRCTRDAHPTPMCFWVQPFGRHTQHCPHTHARSRHWIRHPRLTSSGATPERCIACSMHMITPLPAGSAGTWNGCGATRNTDGACKLSARMCTCNGPCSAQCWQAHPAFTAMRGPLHACPRAHPTHAGAAAGATGGVHLRRSCTPALAPGNHTQAGSGGGRRGAAPASLAAALTLGLRLGHVVGVTGEGPPHKLCKDVGAARLGVLELLQHQHACTNAGGFEKERAVSKGTRAAGTARPG